ncbi:transcriptional regulator of acetoin/glycerol metabolism [Thioclava sp. ES.031]|uniref:sigma-54-dependent Fis family transcriptional regulator n=1 Tax=Thioclava sp. ES.031 TaxID=1798203 RepID=UPI000BF62D1F|nr:sigma-54-dependent Fis family transcriptional regulator [Thioclava sp. ES.031]PFG62162.1 transcriptional regulator of acetoin/glycerol metabolism [Thioclava sp. ES.031]
MRDAGHVEEIGRVLDGSQTGRDSFVSASWRRCVELYGMDPTRSDPAHIVTEAELRDHRKQAEWMIAAARSGLQSLFRQVAGQNYVLLLTDAKGVCVDFFGDDLFTEDLRSAGLYLGSNWSEDLAGTCGVGACIVTQEPVTVHQDDHFGNAHTVLSCTAAPIFDSLGQLAAVLDISLLRSPTPKSSQNLAMNLVTSAARRVEMANLMAESPRDWVLRLSASPEFLDVDPEAAVRLDGSGRVLGYTRAARRLFPEGAPILGRGIDEVLSISVDDLPDLMRDRPTEERVIEMRDGGALFGHAIAPKSPRRPHQGMSRGGPLAGLTGGDPEMNRLIGQAERLAPGTVPLLICGETGTGKTKLARAIHMTSKAQGFISLECAGLDPQTLMQSCAEAMGPTTLLLRRIEEIAPETAIALGGLLDRRPELRTLATSCFEPSQIALPRPLFHRLAGGVLNVPPLRMRRDLDWLMSRHLRRHAGDAVRLSPSARAELLGRSWPGNIRELEQVLDVAAALCVGSVIDLLDLPAPLEVTPQIEKALPAPSDPWDTLEEVLDACEWNMARAARRLGVNRSTILRRIRKAGLRPPE